MSYGVKFAAYRDDFWADYRDLVQCCFISTIPITTILVGMVLLPYATVLVKILIVLGIFSQLAFAMYRAAGLWRGLHTMTATTPIIYLPTVATNFVSATALGTWGEKEYAMLFFGAGILSWFSLEAAILSRLRTETAIAAPVRGIMGVQLAPAFVGCGAYFAMTGGRLDEWALMLMGYGLLQFLFFVRLIRWLFENGFGMSFWGFSFGLAAMVGCGLHLIALQKMALLGGVMAISGSVLIVGLLIGTVYLMLKGKFLVK